MTKTMTEEEVARDVEVVDAAMRASSGEPGFMKKLDAASLALPRLAAQAARVPGLEADLAQRTRERDSEMEERWKVSEVARQREARAEQAESDRDALQERLTAVADERDDALAQRDAALELSRTAESERDAARQERDEERDEVERVDRLYDAVADVLDAAGIPPRLDDKGEEDGTQQAERVKDLVAARDAAQKEAAGRRASNIRLRERVATLEGQVRDERGNATLQVHRADTAESRVRELEEDRAVALSVLAEHGSPEHSGDDEVPPGVVLSLAERIRRLASHPAPTTRAKCSHCGGKGYDVDTDEEGGTQNETHFPCSRCKGKGLEPSPTPPPGLLEAVEPFLCLLRDMAALALSDDSPANLSTRPVEDVTLGNVRSLLAAYDAAKGGEHPDSVAARANFNDLRRILEMATLGSHVGDTDTAMGEKTVQAVRKLHKDAEKYHAAVEGIQRARNLLLYPTAPWDEAVPEVLRVLAPLVSDTPAMPTATLDKARVVEVLTTPLGMSFCPTCGFADHSPGSDGATPFCNECDDECGSSDETAEEVQKEIARRLGLTLATPPAGPGGGERTRTVLESEIVAQIGRVMPVEVTDARTEGMAEALEDVAHGLGVLPLVHLPPTRARIAPTPTQEVPPQPSTHDVVWEWDGLGGWMVAPDGGLHSKHYRHGGVFDGWIEQTADYQPAIGQVAIHLAQALAEAKREAGAITHTLRQYQRGDERDAGETLERLLRERRDLPNQAWKEAAEDMRERAKQVILKQQATEEDGPTSDDNGYAFNMLLRLADEVGKLPLE